jgi:tRNA dimethylallyltransferase
MVAGSGEKTVILVVGATGSGKTVAGISLAKQLSSVIISADSRQIYREIPIGTAAPTIDEQREVPHYLVGIRSIFDYYNAYEFEQDALAITARLFEKYDTLLMVGGSMMYIDAFCNSIDELPTVDPQLRNSLKKKFEEEGIEAIRRQLKQLDPLFYTQVDIKNTQRVIHAVEICLMTGQPYSSLRTSPRKKRPFRIVKIGLDMERSQLYSHINQRVFEMMRNGLEHEAHNLYEHRHLNALNTVGYKELFACFDGQYNMDKAVELIQRNSRHYAKKQLSWFKRDKEIKWLKPDEIEHLPLLWSGSRAQKFENKYKL